MNTDNRDLLAGVYRRLGEILDIMRSEKRGETRENLARMPLVKTSPTDTAQTPKTPVQTEFCFRWKTRPDKARTRLNDLYRGLHERSSIDLTVSWTNPAFKRSGSVFDKAAKDAGLSGRSSGYLTSLCRVGAIRRVAPSTYICILTPSEAARRINMAEMSHGYILDNDANKMKFQQTY